jgi:predicted nucleotidyltransferase component of viral defense system
MKNDLENTAAAGREALQSRLLVELMGNALAKELVLKGGLAMRLAHGSERYTKDIDLDAAPAFSVQRIQGIVRRSIASTIASGLIDNAVVTDPKQTETTLRWKISGTQPGSSEPLHLTVEVSRRDPLVPRGVVELSAPGFNARTPIQVLSSQAIAVSKVFALTATNRVAVRDLFDLHVLIEANVEDPSGALSAVPDAASRIGASREELWPKIEMMTYKQFRQEVIPFLPTATANAMDEQTFEDLRMSVWERVDRWLKDAADKLEGQD